MTGEVRYINDVKDIYDTWFGYMGDDEPTEREINEKDYLLIGVACSQRDAESICGKLNEQNEELIEYCNFSLHDLLDKKNKEIEQLKSDNQELKQDNDIKFWKQECIYESNANSVLLFELGRAIDGGYEVSDKFKEFMNDLNKSIENEKKKLERLGLND